jgi:hypothetical protein
VRLKKTTLIWLSIALVAAAPVLYGVAWAVLDSQGRALGSCDSKNLIGPKWCWETDLSPPEAFEFAPDSSHVRRVYYYRAIGDPGPAFCPTLMQSKPPTTLSSGPFRETPDDCKADTRYWSEVDCKTYALAAWPRCFHCSMIDPDGTSRTYIYGFDRECTLTVEQVSCNFDPNKAAELLQKQQPFLARVFAPEPKR